MSAADVTTGINNSNWSKETLARYALECKNAEKVATIESTAQLSWQALVTAFLTGVGLVKQYDMMEKQGELYEAQRDATLRNIALTESQYNNMALPAYKKAEEYFHSFYRRQWETKLKAIADCGLKDCEYTPDYNRWIARGLADVAKVVNQAKLSGRRMLDCYSAGACCEQDYRFAELQAVLVSDTVNMGRVYEDDRKQKLDQFYWNKQTTVAQIIQNIGNLAGNMNQYGKSNLTQSLALQTQAVAGFNATVESGFAALGQQGSFYGSLGNIAGNLFGTGYGKDAGQAVLQKPYSPLGQVLTPDALPYSIGTNGPSTATLPYIPEPMLEPK